MFFSIRFLSMHCSNISGSQVVKLLTTFGADVVCPDEAEATAYDWAMQGTEGWLVLWLCQHMLENDVYLGQISSRPHTTWAPKWWFSKGNPLISGKSRLVKYYSCLGPDLPVVSVALHVVEQTGS